MENMILMGDIKIPKEAISRQIAESVDLIVQVKRLRDGSRRTTNITEVIGMEGDVIVTQELFKFEYLDESEDGKILGEFRSSGLRPYTLEKARQFGFDQAYLEACLAIRAKIAGSPVYKKVQVATFSPGSPTTIASGQADVVLTFRNVHSWMGEQSPIADRLFAEAFRVLKPGGTLGVVEHRLPEEAEDGRQLTSGYVKVSTVRRLAEAAGFRFVESSEINANPRDLKDYDAGVWTLPPTLRLGDKDREKYLAIGESDRMTLKFVKPQATPGATAPSSLPGG
jgi:predicted methyltransferase